ncbi:13125_t:CDS:2 [Acaulospora colombiana]|uniref:13125_t:CDS:1 n=1 Tax=Acaulospora colombiana TaxID=27376 RepID=A0ACA9K0B6_9GLOM|nr:13125_t:CDS:2 [Acaulospora colombiana]
MLSKYSIKICKFFSITFQGLKEESTIGSAEYVTVVAIHGSSHWLALLQFGLADNKCFYNKQTDNRCLHNKRIPAYNRCFHNKRNPSYNNDEQMFEIATKNFSTHAKYVGNTSDHGDEQIRMIS